MGILRRRSKNKITDYGSTTDGDKHFTEEGRVAEITVDLVPQVRAKMPEDEVNGSGDSIVSQMIKQPPHEHSLLEYEMFPRSVYGAGRSPPSSWKTCEICSPADA